MTPTTFEPRHLWDMFDGDVEGIGEVVALLVRDVPGYASLIVVMLVCSALILISIGVLGEYLGRIYDEVKQRPHYIIRDVITRGVSMPSVSTPSASASESRPNTDAH